MKLSQKFFLTAILFFALFLRVFDVNWDQGNHLHPDERFLTMVASAMKTPASFNDYLNPSVSTFNPANINYAFYVYGTFPVVVTKLLALGLQADNYNDFTILGRIISALLDTIIVFLVFKTIQLFEKEYKLNTSLKLWGAFFYAIATLPIQLAHFFAVDTFLNLFAFTSLYFVLRFYFTKKYIHIVWSALFFGLAVGTKISILYFAPIVLFFLLKSFLPNRKIVRHDFYQLASGLLLFGLCAYFVGRLADPYLFQTSNFFDPQPNKLFLSNLKTLESWGNPDAWFPPSVQWIHTTPVLFALTNLVMFGTGIVYALLSFFGMFIVIIKKRKLELIAIAVWTILFFLYESMQFSKTMRYFLMMYPFLAIFAAIGFCELTKKRGLPIMIGVLCLVLIWPLMFFSIYTKDHSRTQASQWIYKFVPTGSILLCEYWDDALPLAINPPTDKKFDVEQMHVFDPDTPEKWKIMNAQLAKGNYIILASNRGWGSMPKVPERYPLMKKYYADLLANKTNYKKVAEFTSYPSLNYVGIPITFPDNWGEEAYTVIDHQQVMIFKKQ